MLLIYMLAVSTEFNNNETKEKSGKLTKYIIHSMTIARGYKLGHDCSHHKTFST